MVVPSTFSNSFFHMPKRTFRHPRLIFPTFLDGIPCLLKVFFSSSESNQKLQAKPTCCLFLISSSIVTKNFLSRESHQSPNNNRPASAGLLASLVKGVESISDRIDPSGESICFEIASGCCGLGAGWVLWVREAARSCQHLGAE